MGFLDELIGTSETILALRAQASRLLAREDSGRGRLPPILILGETGSGKGLLIRALHQASRRRERPLIEVNCAAIPDTLVEAGSSGSSAARSRMRARPSPGSSRRPTAACCSSTRSGRFRQRTGQAADRARPAPGAAAGVPAPRRSTCGSSARPMKTCPRPWRRAVPGRPVPPDLTGHAATAAAQGAGPRRAGTRRALPDPGVCGLWARRPPADRRSPAGIARSFLAGKRSRAGQSDGARRPADRRRRHCRRRARAAGSLRDAPEWRGAASLKTEREAVLEALETRSGISRGRRRGSVFREIHFAIGSTGSGSGPPIRHCPRRRIARQQSRRRPTASTPEPGLRWERRRVAALRVSLAVAADGRRLRDDADAGAPDRRRSRASGQRWTSFTRSASRCCSGWSRWKTLRAGPRWRLRRF